MHSANISELLEIVNASSRRLDDDVDRLCSRIEASFLAWAARLAREGKMTREEAQGVAARIEDMRQKYRRGQQKESFQGVFGSRG